MEVGLVFMPKEKSLIGISYDDCECVYKDKLTRFHQVGIGIGFIMLYLIFYKKGEN